MSYMWILTSKSMLDVQMGTWMFKSAWLPRMCTWLSKSMFDFQNGTWFPKSMFDFPNGNMDFQIDVGCQFTLWVQTMGSNNGFKHDAMHKSGIILMCWMIHSLSAPPRLPSSPPFLFPVVCPLQSFGNSIAGPLHNTAVEHISYVFCIWWCRH